MRSCSQEGVRSFVLLRTEAVADTIALLIGLSLFGFWPIGLLSHFKSLVSVGKMSSSCRLLFRLSDIHKHLCYIVSPHG